jgi:hypothetical protein
MPRYSQLSQKERQRRVKSRDQVKMRENEETRNIKRDRNVAVMKRSLKMRI